MMQRTSGWMRWGALLTTGLWLASCAARTAEPKLPDVDADAAGDAEASDDGDGAGADSSSGGGLVGKPAPGFKLSSADESKSISLDELRGKVVVVDFWATWCDPCKESFPGYQRLSEEFGDDLVVVGVSVDEEPDGIEAFRDATGVKFPLMWDDGGRTAESYAPPKMPTSYVVDKDGVVRHVHAGYHEEEEDALRREIKALLTTE